jgi:hypothetical protein
LSKNNFRSNSDCSFVHIKALITVTSRRPQLRSVSILREENVFIKIQVGDLESMREDIYLFKFVVLDIMLIVHTETFGTAK